MSRTLGQSAVEDYRCNKKLSPQVSLVPKLVSKPQSSPVRNIPTASARPAAAPAPLHGTGPIPPTDLDSERRTPDTSFGPGGPAGQLSLSVGSLGGSYVEKTSLRKRVRGLSEGDVTQLLRRYASPLLMALLREIARTTTSKLDWAAIQRKALPGLKSTRECQAIWRLIAYGAPIQGAFEDNAEPTESESDLEDEGELSTEESPELVAQAAKAANCVKADLRRLGIVVESGPAHSKSRVESASRQADFPHPQPNRSPPPLIPITSDAPEPDDSTSARTAAYGSPPLYSRSQGTSQGQSQGGGAWRGGGEVSGEGDEGVDVDLSPTPEAVSSGARKKRKLWTLEEDDKLIAAVNLHGEANWQTVVKGPLVFERTPTQLSQRWGVLRRRKEKEVARMRRLGLQAEDWPAVIGPLANADSTAAEPSGPDSPSTLLAVPVGPSFLETSANSGSEAPSPNPWQYAQLHPPPDAEPYTIPSPHPGLQTLRGQKGQVQRFPANSGGRSGGGGRGVGPPSRGSPGAGAGGGGGQRYQGRLLAPGAKVMSAAAAQAAQVGGAEMWSTRMCGPDPMVQAAAMAAGARISPASAMGGMHHASSSSGGGRSVPTQRSGGGSMDKAMSVTRFGGGGRGTQRTPPPPTAAGRNPMPVAMGGMEYRASGVTPSPSVGPLVEGLAPVTTPLGGLVL